MKTQYAEVDESQIRTLSPCLIPYMHEWIAWLTFLFLVRLSVFCLSRSIRAVRLLTQNNKNIECQLPFFVFFPRRPSMVICICLMAGKTISLICPRVNEVIFGTITTIQQLREPSATAKQIACLEKEIIWSPCFLPVYSTLDLICFMHVLHTLMKSVGKQKVDSCCRHYFHLV